MCAPFVSSWRANNIKIYFPKAAAENPKGGSTPVARKHFTPYFRQLDANSSVEIPHSHPTRGPFYLFFKTSFSKTFTTDQTMVSSLHERKVVLPNY